MQIQTWYKAIMNFTIKAYNSVTRETERTAFTGEDYDDAAHEAWKLYGARNDVKLWTLIIMGPIGNKRAELLDGWYPGLWEPKKKRKAVDFKV